MAELRDWLIWNDYKYLIPVSLVLIFTLTYLFRNKSWKKCIQCFAIGFIASTLCHYFFFVLVRHLKPGLSWRILSTDLLLKAIDWSFYAMLNFLVLRSVLGILHLCKAKKAVCILILLPVCSMYIMFYLLIRVYESYLFGPLLSSIFDRIPEFRY